MYKCPVIVGELGSLTFNAEDKIKKYKNIVEESVMEFSKDVRIRYKFSRK